MGRTLKDMRNMDDERTAMNLLRFTRLTVVTLVGTVGSCRNIDESVPGLVLERMGDGQVVCRQIKVLLHVRESQTSGRVVGLGIKSQRFVDDSIGDGREEDSQIGWNVGG